MHVFHASDFNVLKAYNSNLKHEIDFRLVILN